jgi:hypothetical protein
MEASRMKIVYAVCERNGRQCLSRVGIAFIDADGALNVKLEALPVSGELRIIDYAPSDATASHPASDAVRSGAGRSDRGRSDTGLAAAVPRTGQREPVAPRV